MAKPKKSSEVASGIDRSKLRTKLRQLNRGDLLLLLERAIDVAADEQIVALVKDYIRPSDFTGPAEERTLLEETRAFTRAALAGEYYESFRVDSRNCTMHSRGTESFMADFDRLMTRALGVAGTAAPHITRETIELLLAPLRRIDEGMDDVLFFGDEGGSWQLHVDWSAVLPVYFQALTAAADPSEFAREVDRVIEDFVDFDRATFLAMARKAATVAQRKELDRLPAKAPG